MAKFDIVPRGGFVIVGRNEVDPYIKNGLGEYATGNGGEKLMKHPMDIRIEELMNVYATVFSVGSADPRTGEQFEGVKGQRVIIAPEVFIPIDLDDGDRVWLGPMAGVKAFFIERGVEPDAVRETDELGEIGGKDFLRDRQASGIR